MSVDLETLEKRKLDELVREYSASGYEVLVNPSTAELPGFLREIDYRPDLIARSADDNIVVEVKTRESLRGDKRLSRVSELVGRHAAWNFVLVYTNPGRGKERELRFHTVDSDKLLEVVEYARRLFGDSNEERARSAALLLLWSAFEAAATATVRSTGSGRNARSTGAVIRDAITLGLLSREDHGFLLALLGKRNALAHGALDVDVSNAELTELADLCGELASAPTH